MASFLTNSIFSCLNRNKIKKAALIRENLPDGFTITCHAGSFRTEPNSLESIRTAVEWGAQIVEFDVSFRPDGTPVIIHDSNPTADEGVLLEEALKIVAESESCEINLDLKSTANVAALDEMMRACGLWGRVFFTGVSDEWVKTVKEQSEIPYYLNHGITIKEASDPSAAQKIIDEAKSLGAIGINSYFHTASKMFVETARKSGMLVSLWTVNKTSDAMRVLSMLPDNITTKRPDIISALINSK